MNVCYLMRSILADIFSSKVQFNQIVRFKYESWIVVCFLYLSEKRELQVDCVMLNIARKVNSTLLRHCNASKWNQFRWCVRCVVWIERDRKLVIVFNHIIFFHSSIIDLCSISTSTWFCFRSNWYIWLTLTLHFEPNACLCICLRMLYCGWRRQYVVCMQVKHEPYL